jgi:hypothetical protein
MPNCVHRFVGLAVVAALIPACDGGRGIPIDELEATWLDEDCARDVACGYFPDHATCLEANPRDPWIAQLVRDVEVGVVIYDEVEARRCLDEIDARPWCSLDWSWSWEPGGPCYEWVEGTVPVNGACVDNLSCADDNWCAIDPDCTDACCVGTCVAFSFAEFVPIGASCAEANCVAGAFCNSQDVCTALIDVGERCDELFDCVPGAVCSDGFGEGTCVHVALPGETCDPAQWYSCVRYDNYCDPITTVCTINKDVGEACDVELRNCLDFAYCDAGTCVAKPSLGEGCVADGAPDCLGSLECAGGRCVVPEPEPVCTLD